jgi:phosphomannomutase
MKNLMAFDLDGTLAVSKSAIDSEMVELLERLVKVVPVAIISGGDWPQFLTQLVAELSDNVDLSRVILLPTCGTKLYRFKQAWQKIYSEDLTANEKGRTLEAITHAVARSGFKPEQTWGELIEDRGTQITYSALGQQAPIEAKRDWDPDFAKRRKLKADIDAMIPDLSVHFGGTTSVDVTRPGIDKAYGIGKIEEIVGVPVAEMLFVGDALFPGGNDSPVREMGVASIQVRDPDETKRVIETFLACCA